MALSRRALRVLHRGHALLTALVLAASLTMYLTGVCSANEALVLFGAVELPLLAVLVAITILRFKRPPALAREHPRGLLARVADEEPFLRGAVSELRAFLSLALLLGGRRDVPKDARAFGYGNGSLALPLALAVVSAIELVVVHLLVPWTWLQIALLILTLWGVLFVLGYLASRVVHPHFLTGEELHLRWGHSTVLVTPLSNITAVESHTDHRHTQPVIEDGKLVLTAFQSTNVRLRFAAPVPAAAPVSKRALPPGFRTDEVLLFVNAPGSFIATLRDASREAGDCPDND